MLLSFDFEFVVEVVVVAVAAAAVEDEQAEVVVAVVEVVLQAFRLQELHYDEVVLPLHCEEAVGASLSGEDRVDGSRLDSLTCPL